MKLGLRCSKEVNNYTGSIRYYKDDKLHRADGPAVELARGYKGWMVNGEFHREDGPARTWITRYNKRYHYYLNNVRYSNKDKYDAELQRRKLNVIDKSDASRD